MIVMVLFPRFGTVKVCGVVEDTLLAVAGAEEIVTVLVSDVEP